MVSSVQDEPVVAPSLPYVPIGALVLTVISSSLSIVGAAAIFWTFLRLDYVRNTSRRLLLFLTFADLLTALGNLIGTIRYQILYDGEHPGRSKNDTCTDSAPLCVAQSFWTTFSAMSSFFWTVAIAIFFYVSLVRQRPVESKKLLTPFHIMCWGVPGVISLVALGCGVLGDDFSLESGAWCWISGCLSSNERILWMVFGGKGWEMAAYVLSAVLLVIYFYQRSTQSAHSIFEVANDGGGNFRNEDINFFFVPLFLYFLRIWGTIRFFVASFKLTDDLDEYSRDTLDSVLLYLQCIGESGQAFCNFVLFCLLDQPVREWMFRWCLRRREINHIQDIEHIYGAI